MYPDEEQKVMQDSTVSESELIKVPANVRDVDISLRPMINLISLEGSYRVYV